MVGFGEFIFRVFADLASTVTIKSAFMNLIFKSFFVINIDEKNGKFKL